MTVKELAKSVIDKHVGGFVSETNATNVFLITSETVLTPHADSCLPGITRSVVLAIAREAEIPVSEKKHLPHGSLHS